MGTRTPGTWAAVTGRCRPYRDGLSCPPAAVTTETPRRLITGRKNPLLLQLALQLLRAERLFCAVFLPWKEQWSETELEMTPAHAVC